MHSWYQVTQNAKKLPTASLDHQQCQPLIQGGIDPCFHVVNAQFLPYHLNGAAEID